MSNQLHTAKVNGKFESDIKACNDSLKEKLNSSTLKLYCIVFTTYSRLFVHFTTELCVIICYSKWSCKRQLKPWICAGTYICTPSSYAEYFYGKKLCKNICRTIPRGLTQTESWVYNEHSTDIEASDQTLKCFDNEKS